MSSQRSASAPVATRSVSARWTRWVTRRQKSPALPVTVCAASSGPQLQTSPEGATRSMRNSSAGASRPWTEWAKLRVRTPRWATWRIRSVSSTSTPRPSCTSRLCAQVSISRAVAIDVADIGGPNHGIFSPFGIATSAARRSARARRQRPIRSSSWASASAWASTYPSGSAIAPRTTASHASLSVAALTATSSVQARWATCVATSQPGAGVGVRQPSASRSATSASSRSPSAARSSSTWVSTSVIGGSCGRPDGLPLERVDLHPGLSVAKGRGP